VYNWDVTQRRKERGGHGDGVGGDDDGEGEGEGKEGLPNG